MRPVRPVQSVSVLMPTWQGIEFLERALTALAAQRLSIPWDFRAIDSGSTDGTWELLGRFAERFPVPFVRERIDKLEFDHGDTRNLLAARSSGDLLVFLTQDAVPIGEDWLARLVANFEDARVGAAYCRNVARPSASLLTRVFSANDPGYTSGRREVRLPEPSVYALMNAHERRVLYNFNDVASAVRRELWELHPFPRTWFGEDVLMARALLEAGFTVVYDDEATVEHSHDYDAEENRARARIDARFNAEWLDRICVASRGDARILTERQLEADRDALQRAGLSDVEYGRALENAAQLRSATFEGLFEGGQTKLRHPSTRMLERADLDVLYVVHGFPPDTWAGTEVYTYNLAQEMQRRGHRVTILTRAPAKPLDTSHGETLVSGSLRADGTPEDFSLTEMRFQGLRVLRLTHRLEHRSIKESYSQPRAEAVFRALLARERFDVVHFQHLIHLSVGLVDVAQEANLATLITCHDYWALCARVQLIRPDGVRCEENMGSGCFLCVKEKSYTKIPHMKRLDGLAAPLFDALSAGMRRGRSLSPRMTKRWDGFSDLRARHDEVVGAYRAADLRISPSRFLRAKLIDTAGFDAHTLLYSDNGMRTDHLRALEKRRDAQGRLQLGFVGSLVWYKGGEVLLNALRELDAQGLGARVVLHVHGDFQPERDPHHTRLKELAGANVVFHGRFDNARLSEVMAGIDALVVPSTWFENSPVTIHEAWLTRTPVLASDIGGMQEYVKHGIDGLHFKAGDARDLAAQIRRLIEEPGLLASLAPDPAAAKTIADDARAMEFRYRALACRQRASKARGPRVLWEKSGVEAASRSGAVEPQGADMLLVRPGGAVEYDVAGAGGGRRVLRVEQFVLGAEPGITLGGRVLVDGNLVGRLELAVAKGRDEVVARELELELPRHATCVRLEPLPGAFLRVKRIAVISAPRVEVGA